MKGLVLVKVQVSMLDLGLDQAQSRAQQNSQCAYSTYLLAQSITWTYGDTRPWPSPKLKPTLAKQITSISCICPDPKHHRRTKIDRGEEARPQPRPRPILAKRKTRHIPRPIRLSYYPEVTPKIQGTTQINFIYNTLS